MGLDVKLLRESFDLVATREPEVAMRFYGILFRRYPQVQPLFGRSAQANQAKMLTEMLVAVLDHLEDAQWLQTNLRALGVRHMDYGVTREMYPMVGECLLAALAEVAGDAWTPQLSNAWSEAYDAIVTLMLTPAEGARL